MKSILAFVLIFLGTLACLGAARAADFSNWAVLIVAGDDRAHSGAPSQVFDNARRDLTRAFTGIGFSPANMAQFSVDPDGGALTTSVPVIADTLWDLTNRASGGCLIYFTSHGSPEGIVANRDILTPEQFGRIVTNSCGAKPSVIVISACYSGQFVPALSGPHRVVITAARPDRTSFGCGEFDKYTFFDDCFLRALPKATGFLTLGGLVQECVAFREKQLNATPPSEPQVAVGTQVGSSLDWSARAASAVLRPVP